MKLLDEFKSFALKGNVIDLAVGVVIGAAFGKVVTSLVSDIIMPPVGWLIGGVDFTNLTFDLPKSPLNDQIVTVKYGNFIQTLLDFIIVAMAIFMAIKFMIKLKIKEEKKAPVAKTTKEEELLTEIRDLLKNQTK